MGTRNIVWASRQRAGGPLEKLLFLHLCDAIPERGQDPRLETSRGYLAAYAETSLWRVDAALITLELRELVTIEVLGERLILRIPFPSETKGLRHASHPVDPVGPTHDA